MQRYASYKSSGLDWLGDIPSHWGLKKSKFLWREKEDRSLLGDEELLSVSQYSGVVPRAADSRSESLEDYKRCKPNELVINIMLAWMSGLGVSKYSGIVSPAYCVYRQLEDHNPSYFDYLYRTPQYLAEFARRSKGIVPSRWRMYTEDFGQVLSLLPLREEQDRVVAFLDQKTAEIDAAIVKKERLIELLSLQMNIKIDQAITCGLEPDVPLKDNDLLYAKKMPEHWVIKKVKHVSLISPSKTLDGRRRTSESVCFLPMEKIGDDGTINSDDSKAANEVFDGFTYFRKGDVVIAKITPCFENGKGAWLNELPTDYGFGTTELHVLRPTKIHGEFLFRLLNRMGFLAQGEEFMVGSAGQKRVPTLFIANYLFACPPVEEQREICAWISDLCTRTESLIRTEIDAISRLRELKQVLIASAVTGRIRVNGN